MTTGRVCAWTAGLLLGGSACASSPALPVDLKVVEQTRHYVVDAASLDEMAAQIYTRGLQSNGGERVHGLTEVAMTSSFELQPVGTGCRFQKASVLLELVVWLPEWQPGAAVDEGLRGQWSRIEQGLTVHEDGHRALARVSAEALAAKLGELSSDVDCRRLRNRADALLTREMTRLNLRNESYDLRTRRGETQGAVFRPVWQDVAQTDAGTEHSCATHPGGEWMQTGVWQRSTVRAASGLRQRKAVREVCAGE